MPAAIREKEHINILTVDLEDYWSIFHRDWLFKDSEPTEAVVRNTERLLELLGSYRVKATFFVLGEVAQKFPELIKKVADAGHEIGCHGMYHFQIFKLTTEQFRQEMGQCKKLLEDLVSQPVESYRAPAFSITPQTSWALEVLAEEDFRYDSSIFPIAARRYGWPGFSKEICVVCLPSKRSIIEVPLSAVTVLGKALPTGGGGYLRHFPYAVTRWGINHINKSRPAVVYIHPYETDTQQENFVTEHLSEKQKKAVVRFHKMQMRNRKTVAGKLTKLLKDYKFDCLKAVAAENIKCSFSLQKIN